MRIKYLLLITLLLYGITVSAQISGIVKDKDGTLPVENAAVVMLRAEDSVLQSFTRTNTSGKWQMPTPPNGRYTFIIMHPGYADYAESISINGIVSIPDFAVTGKSKLLQEVIINSAKSIRVKGDTTIFTADSFNVSANANVEELLKKLPGLQVDKDGKITAQGKNVETVLVDGEPFFGDDPGMAVKNLRADAVKEVQVFDKKSEQAEFTGIDDGETKKTINLKLKENAKKGFFGKIDLSGGPLQDRDARYNNNLLFSTFKGKRKISAFFLNGNTNQDGLSWQDADKYGTNDANMEFLEDGGIMMWSGSRSSDDEIYVNADNGFVRNINAGIQYTDKFNDSKTGVNFSPRYNDQVYNNNVQGFTQVKLSADSVLNTTYTDRTNLSRQNQKFSTTLDFKLDSSTKLIVKANANFYHTENNVNGNSAVTGAAGNLKNSRSTSTMQSSDKQAFGSTITLQHSFKKPRRTFSLSTGFNSINSDGDVISISDNRDFTTGNQILLNQKFVNDKQSINGNAAITYTEPIGKKYAILLSQEYSVNKGDNTQDALSYTPGTGKYDAVVDSLSNSFDQLITVVKPGAKLTYSTKKIKWNVGSSFGITKFNFNDNTFNKDYNRRFTNIFPTGSLTYSYKSSSSLRVNYNGSTIQPSLYQLQPLRNNTNQFDLYIGNPNLRQSFRNSINVSQHSYNFLKDRYIYQNISFTKTYNAIIEARQINVVNGATTRQPINADGQFNINYYGGGGLKLKKLDTRLNINSGVSYYRQPVSINGLLDYSNNLSPFISLNLNKSKDKKYDVSMENSVNYNYNNFGPSSTVTRFVTFDLEQTATYYFTKSLFVRAENEFSFRQSAVKTNPNQTFNILNATLSKSFHQDEFTLYITGRDLLNQNIGVEQYTNGNTYSKTVNERLQRYFLVGFRWDFKNKTATVKK